MAETHPVHPECAYGISKHTVEHYLELYRLLYGLNYVVLRYPNVYGPRQNPHGEAGVNAIFTGMMLKGQTPTIFGDGEALRDYVYRQRHCPGQPPGAAPRRRPDRQHRFGRRHLRQSDLPQAGGDHRLSRSRPTTPRRARARFKKSTSTPQRPPKCSAGRPPSPLTTACARPWPGSAPKPCSPRESHSAGRGRRAVAWANSRSALPSACCPSPVGRCWTTGWKPSHARASLMC